MNARVSTEQIGAMRVAEWKAQAALTGQPFHEVACEAMRSRSRRELPADEAWGSLGELTRSALLTLCTDRENVARVYWRDLTENEKMAVGAMARTMAAELAKAAGHLRA